MNSRPTQHLFKGVIYGWEPGVILTQVKCTVPENTNLWFTFETETEPNLNGKVVNGAALQEIKNQRI